MGEFHQGQRVAGRFFEDPRAGPARGGEQPVGCRTVQRAEFEALVPVVEAGQCGRGADSEQQGDGPAVHAACQEGEHVQGRAVDPLGVVDHDQQRVGLREVRQQGQNRQTHEHPVGCLGTLVEAQDRAERGALPRRQPRRPVENRAQHLVKTREPEVRLGHAPHRPQHPVTRTPCASGRDVCSFRRRGRP